MNMHSAVLPLAVLAGLACGMQAGDIRAAGDRPVVGGVERLEREATATYDNDTRPLAPEADIFFQDLLETSDRARLAVTLEDGTRITLGENASLRVDRFVYEPAGDSAGMGLSVLEGAFVFVGGHAERQEDSEVEIETSVGTLGVRGTIVWGGPIDGSTGFLVVDGNVTVRNEAGEVSLGPGEGTMVEGRDVAPSQPKQWPREKVRRSLEKVSFSED